MLLIWFEDGNYYICIICNEKQFRYRVISAKEYILHDLQSRTEKDNTNHHTLWCAQVNDDMLQQVPRITQKKSKLLFPLWSWMHVHTIQHYRYISSQKRLKGNRSTTVACTMLLLSLAQSSWQWRISRIVYFKYNWRKLNFFWETQQVHTDFIVSQSIKISKTPCRTMSVQIFLALKFSCYMADGTITLHLSMASAGIN